jgi:hypothetical protein
MAACGMTWSFGSGPLANGDIAVLAIRRLAGSGSVTAGLVASISHLVPTLWKAFSSDVMGFVNQRWLYKVNQRSRS